MTMTSTTVPSCLPSLVLLATAPMVLAMGPELDGLQQVHLLFRHGDRTPIAAYPTDPYKDYPWPGGWGQLTLRGMRRHLALGRWIRSRYSGWLGEAYNRSETVVRSTDVDRTLMSAQSNLAGLYPPPPEQVVEAGLGWQPVPVHTVPQTEDYLLSSHAHCPRFETLQKEIETGDWMTDIYKQNEGLFKFISRNAGENITDIVKLDYIYDSLLIDSEFNLTLPEWTKDIFSVTDGKFKELRDLSFTVDTLTEELKRLKGGPFIKEITAHFDTIAASKNKTAETKLFIYSAHDTTVAPVLHTLGVFNNVAPPYASMVLVELLDRQGLHVRLSYHNDSSQDPHILTLPGCEPLCPLHKFKALTAKYVPDDILAECGVEAVATAESVTMQRVTMVAAVCSSVMAATVLVATLASICSAKRRTKQDELDFPSARYHPVNTNET